MTAYASASFNSALTYCCYHPLQGIVTDFPWHRIDCLPGCAREQSSLGKTKEQPTVTLIPTNIVLTNYFERQMNIDVSQYYVYRIDQLVHKVHLWKHNRLLWICKEEYNTTTPQTDQHSITPTHIIVYHVTPFQVMSINPLPHVKANCSRSLSSSLVGYSGSLSKLKLHRRSVNKWERSSDSGSSYHVLAMGSLLGV